MLLSHTWRCRPSILPPHPSPVEPQRAGAAHGVTLVTAVTVVSVVSGRRGRRGTSARAVQLPSPYSAEKVAEACGSDVGAVLGRVWQILRRCGAWLLAEPWRRPEDARLAAELRHGLVDLGPSFVKVGQLLSSRVDLLPHELPGDGDHDRKRRNDILNDLFCFPFDTAVLVLRLESFLEISLADTQWSWRGAPLDYVASLQRGAERQLVAEWKRRFSSGHWEIMDGQLEEIDAFRTAKDVKAGTALLFESSACRAAAGPNACEQMARQLEGHARYQEVLQLKGNRFTGETRNPLQSILASNARVCSREPKMVALFVTCSKVPHSCHPNAFLDADGSHGDVLGNLRRLQTVQDCPEGKVDLEDPHNIAQIVQGAGFIALAMWLIFANNSKVAVAQKAPLEQRHAVCATISTAVAFLGYSRCIRVGMG
ncbi:unnamed protein product [Cladocopium goreaui]|uniref:Histidine--tRNA ligase n=1 Tax=Cladocopium goreaui TaxID=2562237 RepID=A0A9P1CDM5_9DINO|nr:unnamed protein product [Cladocopium goreaui]